VSAWQSMESAPLDGTEVLLVEADGGMTVGFYALGFRHGNLDPIDVKDGAEWAATFKSPYSDYAPCVYPVAWAPKPAWS
jgi:hypothetical protein